MPDRLAIDVDGRKATALVYRAADPRTHATLVLAHGAGAGQSSPFIVSFATELASRGLDVVTFNFLYVEEGRRIPDRSDTLEACYRAVINAARRDPLLQGNTIFVGGKSMGGRMASHLAAADDADALGIRGLILLGYPLHPPGKPQQLRVAHLPRIRMPILCMQGARDPFGTPQELGPHFEGLNRTLHVVENGDHSLAPPRRGGLTTDQVYSELQDRIAAWITSLG